ncbi:serine hydrolase [Candidatus Saccharibacteria bacterium]|nr:serine hydrolase [Candidatus Saccharibacteria bacterium]MBR0372573.1 serine hydrolase [Candidatus Saccharibacteria bacterium]
MVLKQIDVGPSVRRRNSPVVLSLLFAVLTITLSIILGVMIAPSTTERTEESDSPISTENTEEGASENSAKTEVKYERIDFQPVIDSWVKSTGGRKSVLIYDLDRDETVGSYHPEDDYGTASIYKLFVVYEGYRRIQNGEWKSDEKAGTTGKTILECLDLAIRESNSVCAETIWKKVGQTKLDKILENDFDIKDSTISKLSSNPKDVMKMMKIYYYHSDITDEALVEKMKDSFLNQPATEYDWRQGLPSGFSKAKVYNKVGWDYNSEDKFWNIYHDSAIVEFPEENRHFIVVVMTNKVSFRDIKKLGTEIENHYYKKS